MSFSPSQLEQLEVLRRICDRGIKLGLAKEDSITVDMFQHMKDELERFKLSGRLQ